MLTERVEFASHDLDDLRKVTDSLEPSNFEMFAIGQKRALSYFEASEVDHLVELGTEMLAALFVAVGPRFFDIDIAGRKLLAEIVKNDEGDWVFDTLEFHKYLFCAGPIGRIISAFGSEKPEVMCKFLCVAAKLMQDDVMRKSVCRKFAPKQSARTLAKGSTSVAPAALATLPELCSNMLSPNVSLKDVGAALATLPLATQAIAISYSYQNALDAVDPKEADMVAERVGRRLEEVVEDSGVDQKELLAHMIKENDVSVVLSMVRGSAGEFTSTAEYLTAELVEELLEDDPDINNSHRRIDRLVLICYTLLVETKHTCDGINDFFRSHRGQAYLALLTPLSKVINKDSESSDDEVDEIVRSCVDRGIPFPIIPEVTDPDNVDEVDYDEGLFEKDAVED